MTDMLDRFMTDEYYPGSKMKREKRVPDPEPEPEFIWPKGRILTISGYEVECFTTGQLADLLGHRKAVTIRAWEASGILPKSGYYVPGRDGDLRGRRRYYTRQQVEGVLDIARQEGVLYPSTRISISKTNFTKRVTELFLDLRKRGIR
jgi:hypothetical protein